MRAWRSSHLAPETVRQEKPVHGVVPYVVGRNRRHLGAKLEERSHDGGKCNRPSQDPGTALVLFFLGEIARTPVQRIRERQHCYRR